MTIQTTNSHVESIRETLNDIADDPTTQLAKSSTPKASNEALTDDPGVMGVNPDSRPSVEMTLDELGLLAQMNHRKSAESIWIVGRALTLAKKKNPRSFGKWCQKWVTGISTKTRERYMAVGSLDWDDVRGKPVTQIYDLLFGGKSSQSKKSNPPTTQATTHAKSLSKLLESNPEVAEANRDLLIELYGKLSNLLFSKSTT